MPRAAARAASSASNSGLISRVMVIVAVPFRSSIVNEHPYSCPKDRRYVTRQISSRALRGWENSSSAAYRLLATDLGVCGQRQQREILPVHVVHQVKHSRKSRAGVERLIPGTVAALRLQQIGDTVLQRIVARVIGGEQSHHRPRCLRRRAWTNSLGVGIVVGIASLAPSAIG